MFLPDIRGKEQIQERRLQIAMKHPYRWDNLNREELRKLARAIRPDNMTRKDIRFAKKQQLIDAIMRYRKQER